jgi:uncharacterized membrane protein YczE
MMERTSLRRADIPVALLLAGFGGWMIWSAAGMPWIVEEFGVTKQWYLSPGLMPAIVGALIIVCSMIVLTRAVREGAHRGLGAFLVGRLAAVPASPVAWRVLGIWVLIGIYVVGLLRSLDHHVATALFALAFMAVFTDWRRVRRLPMAAAIVLVAVLLPLALGHLFERHLGVPLP